MEEQEEGDGDDSGGDGPVSDRSDYQRRSDIFLSRRVLLATFLDDAVIKLFKVIKLEAESEICSIEVTWVSKYSCLFSTN